MRRFTTLLLGILCISTALLTGCWQSNPYIGTWKKAAVTEDAPSKLPKELRDVMSNITQAAIPDDISLEFTEKDMTFRMGTNEKARPITYKEDDKGWAISPDNGKTWERAEFIDKNTMKIVIPGFATLLLARQ